MTFIFSDYALMKCIYKEFNIEMCIRTTLRFHLIPHRMVNINEKSNSSWWPEWRIMGTLIHCWWELKIVQSFWKSPSQFFRKLGIDLTQDPGIPPLFICPKGFLYYYTETCSAVFCCSIHNSQKWETASVSFNR